MTISRSRPFRDDANARVAAYESLLDLFTLISFMLILAAVIYAAPSTSRDPNSSSVVAQIAERGSGVPEALPADVLLLVIYRENSVDRLTILSGATGTLHHFDVTADNIEQTLDGLSSLFNQAGTINMAVYHAKEDINPGIFLAVSRWLTNHRGKYNVYYTGKP